MYDGPKNTEILMVYKDAGYLFKWLRKKHWEIIRYKMLEGEHSIQIRVVDTDTGKEKIIEVYLLYSQLIYSIYSD